MANKTKPETTEETQQANKSTITLKVNGACRVKFGGVNYSHGSEFEVSEADLSGKGVGYLFAQKILCVKDDESKTREVIESHRAGAKKDPNEGKSREELENGGDIK